MSYLRRYDVHKDLTDADQDAMRDLVRSLGHDADNNIAAVIAISVDPIGVRLHLSEYLRDDTGFIALDVAADHPATRPHVHDITAEQLPAAIRPEVRP